VAKARDMRARSIWPTLAQNARIPADMRIRQCRHPRGAAADVAIHGIASNLLDEFIITFEYRIEDCALIFTEVY
jgi:hypothetical protein